MSWLPLQTPPEVVLLAEHLNDSLVTVELIQTNTPWDPVLALIVQFLQQGWANTQGKDPQLAPFFNKKDEISLYEGSILWGTRVVVTTSHQDAVLIELHEGHPSMVRMKGLARMYVWWPGITNDIEKTDSALNASFKNQYQQLPLCTLGSGQPHHGPDST